MDRFEQLLKRRPGHLTPEECQWLFAEVERLRRELSQETSRADNNAQFASTEKAWKDKAEAQLADLQAKLASLREVAKAAERAEKHWPAINKRRFALINKKFSGGLSEEETAELNGLQEVAGILVDALIQYHAHESKWPGEEEGVG